MRGARPLALPNILDFVVQLDPRSVANEILYLAMARKVNLTNLALQKILYFVHGRYLIENEEPLIKGSFEAWQFGPVSLPVYDAFKSFGPRYITKFAQKKNLITGNHEDVPRPELDDIRIKIRDLTYPYLTMSAGRLVELSHAPNSPWELVTRGTFGQRDFGLRISNENIIANFRHHKISIQSAPRAGEPDEESSPY